MRKKRSNKTLIVFVLLVALIMAGLSLNALHESVSDRQEPELCGEHGIVYIDRYPRIDFSFESYQDNEQGERDKGGMLIDKTNSSNQIYDSFIIIRILPGDCVHQVSEPNSIIFYLIFMAWLINVQTRKNRV